MTPHAHRAAAALTAALLTAGAACQAHDPSPRQAGGPTPAPAPTTRGFTLVASGDVLPPAAANAPVLEQAKADAGGGGYDFRPMLAGAEPVVSRADVAICHLETVFGEGGDYAGYPAVLSPPQVALSLAAIGYDGCSTASNHSLDLGTAGIHSTLNALDQAGVQHTGSARLAAEAAAPAMFRADGAQVAHLAYTHDTDGHPLPEGEPWAVSLIDRNQIVADARAARAAGADVVVVSLRWGTEWQDEPDAEQLRLSRELTASQTKGRPDIDLILGTRAHVPQPYEKVNGTWVVYGLGDQIAGEMVNREGFRDPRGQESTIGRFTFAPPARKGERWQVTKAEFIPQRFDLGRVVDLNAAIAQGADMAPVRDRIRDVVLRRGAAKDGLVMGS
ncbi:CapA family protein [Streptomyces avermitilis]|uniref:CapA family protein n=1 Tax=Streptomyces avermitilis TaxID=33903 RepID=UPI0033E63412